MQHDSQHFDPGQAEQEIDLRRLCRRALGLTTAGLLVLLSISATAAGEPTVATRLDHIRQQLMITHLPVMEAKQPAATHPAMHPAVDPAVDMEAPPLVPEAALDGGTLQLRVNHSRIIQTTRPYHRVSIASPAVADVTALGPDSLLVTTKAPGRTQMVLWDAQDRTQTLFIQSQADLSEVQAKLDRLLPEEDITAIDLKGQIALQGRVSSVEVAEDAAAIASAYGEVLNLLQISGNQQVALQIRFAEVSRSVGKEFGVNFGYTDGDGTIAGSNIGQISPLGFHEDNNGVIDSLGIPDPTQAVQIFGIGTVNGDPFTYFINALRASNLLRVLARPELVVTSGSEGEFLAGGKFPYPVPQDDGNVAIQFEEFGIHLQFTPVVLGDGRIRMTLETEVSDLDQTTAVSILGTRVPGLRTRRASTTVELVDGQSFAIAGLLDSSMMADKQVTPLLGDLPIIGALFRSTRYQRRETELVVLITPHLVSPLNPGEIPPLPGEKWKHPNEIELFLLGNLGGEAPAEQSSQGQADGPRLQTTYTYLPPEPAAK